VTGMRSASPRRRRYEPVRRLLVSPRSQYSRILTQASDDRISPIGRPSPLRPVGYCQFIPLALRARRLQQSPTT
jgi:hypothetical protein